MNLDDIRIKIDETDRKMCELFRQRMELSREVACAKIKSGDIIYKPEREKDVVERFAGDAPEDMKTYYEAFIKRVMLISRQYQYEIISEGDNDGCGREISLSFVSKDGWPDSVITSICDLGAVITGMKKEGDNYEITVNCNGKDDSAPGKMRALLKLAASETMFQSKN